MIEAKFPDIAQMTVHAAIKYVEHKMTSAHANTPDMAIWVGVHDNGDVIGIQLSRDASGHALETSEQLIAQRFANFFPSIPCDVVLVVHPVQHSNINSCSSVELIQCAALKFVDVASQLTAVLSEVGGHAAWSRDGDMCRLFFPFTDASHAPELQDAVHVRATVAKLLSTASIQWEQYRRGEGDSFKLPGGIPPARVALRFQLSSNHQVPPKSFTSILRQVV